MSNTVLIRGRYQVSNFGLNLQYNRRQLTSNVLPQTRQALQLNRTSNRQILSDHLEDLILRQRMMMRPVVKDITQNTIVINCSLTNMHTVTNNPTRRIYLNSNLMVYPFTLVRTIFVNSMCTPILRIRKTMIKQDLVIANRSRRFTIVTRHKYVYEMMILQGVIQNIGALILPSKITRMTKRYTVISLNSNSVEVIVQRFIVHIANGTKHIIDNN